jgi:alanyl-tRNA synthetase
MTDRLYYRDPRSREFDATILGVEERDGRTLVRLDRSSFYPTSGGQPFDTGTLGAHFVVDVFDQDDGEIAHAVEITSSTGPVDPAGPGAPALQLAVGKTVHGSIDWTRRFDHMQQHTGQHVLSAAFDRMFGVVTVGFHLGARASTIDLARDMTPRDIAAAEDEANRIVWENRPVTIRFASAEEAARLPLRKEPIRDGTLRLIDVEGFDLSACGGTHVEGTGAIGIIAVAAWERFKGGLRLEFLSGGRTLGGFRLLRDTIAASVRLLSVPTSELPTSIERLQTDAKAQKREAAAFETELVRYRAADLAAAAEPTAQGRLVLRALDAGASQLKALASAVASRSGYIVVLVSTTRPPLVVVARSQDVALGSNELVAALTGTFGGRGGGKADLAQGGGLDAAPDAILEAARTAILSR